MYFDKGVYKVYIYVMRKDLNKVYIERIFKYYKLCLMRIWIYIFWVILFFVMIFGRKKLISKIEKFFGVICRINDNNIIKNDYFCDIYCVLGLF